MRFVPLVPSEFAPAPWAAFPAVELRWQGPLHTDWPRSGLPVHAIHLPEAPWSEGLGEAAMAALRARLDPDFLVLTAPAEEDRMASSRFFAVLEGLLELTHGTGVKLALRPAPGAAAALASRLREARGEAVGFCWDRTVGKDLDSLADRLYTAVALPGDDLAGLQALGYRWNAAVPSVEPLAARDALEVLGRAWPEVLFPANLEGLPDPGVTLGHTLREPS